MLLRNLPLSFHVVNGYLAVRVLIQDFAIAAYDFGKLIRTTHNVSTGVCVPVEIEALRSFLGQEADFINKVRVCDILDWEGRQ